ncbi:MAG: hypothetical protein KGJ02_01595 [Verrucomicrobiota bacterium]|nr:hypothetical protein [Verrucomicrobiota bacterium]
MTVRETHPSNRDPMIQMIERVNLALDTAIRRKALEFRIQTVVSLAFIAIAFYTSYQDRGAGLPLIIGSIALVGCLVIYPILSGFWQDRTQFFPAQRVLDRSNSEPPLVLRFQFVDGGCQTPSL